VVKCWSGSFHSTWWNGSLVSSDSFGWLARTLCLVGKDVQQLIREDKIINDHSGHPFGVRTETKVKTIVLYSPDVDFCMSLEMLFQGQYRIITTSDPNQIATSVNIHQPDLLIADSLPTERMRKRFELMKQEHPHLRVMLFYVARFENECIPSKDCKSIDAIFYKPIDLVEVIQRIDELVRNN
jgi:hypothetical protein